MSRTISRRSLMGAVGAVAVAGTSTIALGADLPPLYDGEILDTHLHLWDLKVLTLPWVEASTGRGREILRRDYLLSDYAEATKGLKVNRAVYMEVNVKPSDRVKEAELVIEICAEGKSPMEAAVISGDPSSDGFGDYLDQFRGSPYIKGIRQALRTSGQPPKLSLDPAFVRGIRMLGDRGLSFDVNPSKEQLGLAADLIEQCPRTRFVMDHCGNPDLKSNDLEYWRRGLARIAGIKDRQVVCKVSGIYGGVRAEEWPAERVAPYVRTVIDLFGWDRVIFAGVAVNLGASFRIWADTVKAIVRGNDLKDQAKLFRENAIRFYGLNKA